ncbi:hypothetical protein [Streptomyces sp. NBC_00103]|uniref:hypothetical protein n=1 Tax=Streptomyces sp. NBC_00103 TaxID=2975653 RepID=UPI00225693A2|nr:hypothetical protein [Streptomyces sp. NBC_00103]MCX5367800.1 hypothetical protein [Streptomyces sp. NBC_00103]
MSDIASVELHPRDRPRYELANKDVLLVEGHADPGEIGRCALVGNEQVGLLYQNHLFRLRFRQVVPEFALLWLNSVYVRSYWRTNCATSSGLYTINSKLLGQVPFPVLPEAEQRRIVAAHAAFERRIGAMEAVAAKRVKLLDALVEHLLQTGEASLVSLKEAGAQIDAGVTLGAHRVPHLRPTGYLRVANVRKGWIEGDIALLEAMERDHRRYSLSPGDLLVVEGHADPEQIGRCAMVGPEQEGLLYQNHLFRLRFDDVLAEFAMLWLNSRAVRSYWKSNCATSSGLYTINSGLLEGVPFPRVSHEEQERVVGVWMAESRALALMRQRIAKLRLIQQSVVEDLLLGRAESPAA